MNNLRGAKIIYQESKATQPSHLYFLQKDANNFDIIVTSESGVKRRLNSSVDLSNYYTKLETYSKNEVDDIISDISAVDVSNLVPYTGATQDVNIGANYFESSAGFRTPNGAPNKALTSNGGTFDLRKKADLDVNGKVPKNQSQPSTMVMNSSYVITFTDATGAVQTINLPIESLFKGASYNSETRDLILTLDNDETIEISLEDLVDLPEIVLATTNPAVTPTTGQKVYFNTSLGKVWFNVSGTWAYAGNLVSDIEKTNFSTAYTHSQTPGNPHGTTKADIGLGNVDNTSDLNKPVSTATQNALNLKVDKVAGKQLSTEDYTTTEKNKLSGIQPGAEANVNADWNATSGDAQILNKPTTFPPSTHTHAVGDITGLQTALDSKQNLLSSFDESILIENYGNIEGNISLFEEYFEQQECELHFNPIQIIAVYQDGIKLSSSEYEIILPKKIKIKEYVDENIQIEYTHLKS